MQILWMHSIPDFLHEIEKLQGDLYAIFKSLASMSSDGLLLFIFFFRFLDVLITRFVIVYVWRQIL